jgi:hypothetical protein
MGADNTMECTWYAYRLAPSVRRISFDTIQVHLWENAIIMPEISGAIAQNLVALATVHPWQRYF